MIAYLGVSDDEKFRQQVVHQTVLSSTPSLVHTHNLLAWHVDRGRVPHLHLMTPVAEEAQPARVAVCRVDAIPSGMNGTRVEHEQLVVYGVDTA